MRAVVVLLGAAAVAAFVRVPHGTSATACSYFATYPPAHGRLTYLLATATPQTVTATVDTPVVMRRIEVPAQVMTIQSVTGFSERPIRDRLDATVDSAVFVRYSVGSACQPWPARDGMLDSTGVNGLYVGHVRPADQWIGGRPTFDIHRAAHYPLPDRFGAPSGHLVMVRVDSTPHMNAAELFGMYRALWSGDIVARDSSLAPRIRRWIADNPEAARRQPALAVTSGLVEGATKAFAASHAIPMGGTFRISLAVDGVDSVEMFGQTTANAALWLADFVRDSGTQLPVDVIPRSFVVDMVTASRAAGFDLGARTNPCPPIPIVIDNLPIAVRTDSTWQARTHPGEFLRCVFPLSPFDSLTTPDVMRTLAEPATVTFRGHPDGRVTFHATASGAITVRVHGERISAATHRPIRD